MSIRHTSIEFEVPRSTLADQVSGRYSIETKPGKKPVIPSEIESQMVTKVMKLDEQDFGIGLRQMLGRAGTVCRQLQLKNNFKDGLD